MPKARSFHLFLRKNEGLRNHASSLSVNVHFSTALEATLFNSPGVAEMTIALLISGSRKERYSQSEARSKLTCK